MGEEEEEERERAALGTVAVVRGGEIAALLTTWRGEKTRRRERRGKKFGARLLL